DDDPRRPGPLAGVGPYSVRRHLQPLDDSAATEPTAAVPARAEPGVTGFRIERRSVHRVRGSDSGRTVERSAVRQPYLGAGDCGPQSRFANVAAAVPGWFDGTLHHAAEFTGRGSRAVWADAVCLSAARQRSDDVLFARPAVPQSAVAVGRAWAGC